MLVHATPSEPVATSRRRAELIRLGFAAILLCCAGWVRGESLQHSSEALLEPGPIPDTAFERAQPPGGCETECRSVERESPCGEGRVNAALARTLGAAGGVAIGAWASGDAVGQARSLRSFGAVDKAVTAASIGWLVADRIRSRRDRPFAVHSSDCPDARSPLNGLDAGVRKALRWEKRAAAARASDALLIASLGAPVGYLAASDTWRDGGFVFEATAVSAALAVAVKHLVHRQRPYRHFCELPCGTDLTQEDSRLSFYSGHATLSFAAAVSMGTLASLHGSRNAGWVWATGLTLATTTSYLRIAGDRHYLTDVLAGAAAGSLVGWAVPRLHRREAGTKPGPTAEASGSGVALSFSWRW